MQIRPIDGPWDSRKSGAGSDIDNTGTIWKAVIMKREERIEEMTSRYSFKISQRNQMDTRRPPKNLRVI